MTSTTSWLSLAGLICAALTVSFTNQPLCADDLPFQGKIGDSSFVEAHADFPREEKNLRKWDAPVIADLDQDGFVDLVLNDHGFGVRVCWNNRGRFAKPYDLIMGDMHGISVGDIDQDGSQEMIIAPGGGSGDNARRAKLFRVTRNRQFKELSSSVAALARMRGRTVKFVDCDNDGDLDLLNFAFPSQDLDGQSENYIYENKGQGQFVQAGSLPAVEKDGQKTLLTDFNGDSRIDLLLYGNGRVKAYQGNGDLTYTDVTDVVLPADITDVTGAVEFDYDNDGDFDLFLTRGREFEKGETFFDKSTSTWGFFTKRGKFQFEDLVTGDVLKVENLQSQWPHKKVFLGESAYAYEFPGETHSGRNIRLVNSDALGWPDKLDEKGAYLGYVGNGKWRFAGEMWAPVTGVMHPVRSYPKCDHSPGPRDILLENENGRFREVTTLAPAFTKEHSTGAAAADFDNNGFQDLLVICRGDLIHSNKSMLFLNHGQKGFERITDHNVISTELGAIGLGAECFDYDRDGWVDILIGNERGKWHLFKNHTQVSEDANFITIAVGYSKSGQATSLGAVVTVKTDQGEQVQRIGATGAAYSRSYNPSANFGLGASSGSVDVKVTWSNGEVAHIEFATVNTRAKVGAFPSQ